MILLFYRELHGIEKIFVTDAVISIQQMITKNDTTVKPKNNYYNY
jgi:hypothetical protein